MRIGAFLAGCLVAGSVSAQVPSDLKEAAAAIKDRFGVEIKSAQKSPSGLYEAVLSNSDVVYFSRDGKYLIAGQLIEMSSFKNLTQERKDEITRFVPSKVLPSEWVFVAGNEQAPDAKTIWVFSDPRCPYCKKAEVEIDKLKDEYKLVYIPLAYQRSDAEVAGVLCAKNRLSAWKKAVENGEESPSTRACRDTVDKIRNFATEKGINGTPTFVLANGRRLQGYMSAEEIKSEVARSQAD